MLFLCSVYIACVVSVLIVVAFHVNVSAVKHDGPHLSVSTL